VFPSSQTGFPSGQVYFAPSVRNNGLSDSSDGYSGSTGRPVEGLGSYSSPNVETNSGPAHPQAPSSDNYSSPNILTEAELAQPEVTSSDSYSSPITDTSGALLGSFVGFTSPASRTPASQSNPSPNRNIVDTQKVLTVDYSFDPSYPSLSIVTPSSLRSSNWLGNVGTVPEPFSSQAYASPPLGPQGKVQNTHNEAQEPTSSQRYSRPGSQGDNYLDTSLTEDNSQGARPSGDLSVSPEGVFGPSGGVSGPPGGVSGPPGGAFGPSGGESGHFVPTNKLEIDWQPFLPEGITGISLPTFDDISEQVAKETLLRSLGTHEFASDNFQPDRSAKEDDNLVDFVTRDNAADNSPSENDFDLPLYDQKEESLFDYGAAKFVRSSAGGESTTRSSPIIVVALASPPDPYRDELDGESEEEAEESPSRLMVSSSSEVRSSAWGSLHAGGLPASSLLPRGEVTDINIIPESQVAKVHRYQHLPEPPISEVIG
jgi:hypothetical protein